MYEHIVGEFTKGKFLRVSDAKKCFSEEFRLQVMQQSERLGVMQPTDC